MVTPAEPVLKTKMEDMGSLRAQRPSGGKPSQHADAFEVLKQYFTKTYGPQQIDQFMEQFARLVQSGFMKLVQIGDTVFGVMPKPNGVAEFYVASIEPLSELPKRIKSLNTTLKNMGFKTAMSFADKPEWAQIYRQSGLPIRSQKVNHRVFGTSMPKTQYVWEVQ